MISVLDALGSFVRDAGFPNVFLDCLPPLERECIALFLWDAIPNDFDGGDILRYLQVQSRHGDRLSAELACLAIFALLDSGPEETLIPLSPQVRCIARPRRAPVLLATDSVSFTYACEISVWIPDSVSKECFS